MCFFSLGMVMILSSTSSLHFSRHNNTSLVMHSLIILLLSDMILRSRLLSNTICCRDGVPSMYLTTFKCSLLMAFSTPISVMVLVILLCTDISRITSRYPCSMALETSSVRTYFLFVSFLRSLCSFWWSFSRIHLLTSVMFPYALLAWYFEKKIKNAASNTQIITAILNAFFENIMGCVFSLISCLHNIYLFLPLKESG
eukprot:jgi/Antlo1/2449/1054